MRLGDYLRLLSHRRFRIHLQRWAMTGLVGGCTVGNSVLAAAQRLFYDRKIRETTLPPPVFVIGHWRSGTTMLHELLALDSPVLLSQYLSVFCAQPLFGFPSFFGTFCAFVVAEQTSDGQHVDGATAPPGR